MNMFKFLSPLILGVGVSVSAYAIVGGEDDCDPSGQNCAHQSAGFMAWTYEGRAAPACSAVAVYRQPDVLVVLTAAHCPVFGRPQLNFDAVAWKVNPDLPPNPYDPSLPPFFNSSMLFDGTFQANPPITDAPTYVPVDKLCMYPNGSSNVSTDIAVLVITNATTLATIESKWPAQPDIYNPARTPLIPTELPTLGYLDTIKRSELVRNHFTAVGNGLSWITFNGASPDKTVAIVTDGTRKLANIKLKNITAGGIVDLNTNPNFYNDGTNEDAIGGMALGDSGGSIYYKDQLVALPANHKFPLNGGGPRLDTPAALNLICPIIKANKLPGDPVPAACATNTATPVTCTEYP